MDQINLKNCENKHTIMMNFLNIFILIMIWQYSYFLNDNFSWRIICFHIPFFLRILGLPPLKFDYWAADCHVTGRRPPIGQLLHHMIPSSPPIGCEVSAGRGSNFWLRSSAVWTEVATWQSRYIFIIFRWNLTVVWLQNCEKVVTKLYSKSTSIWI